jgi:uncharacterized protein YqfB (UPF0267 family)
MRHDHILKIAPEYFKAAVSGKKTFEIRSCDDRDFEEGQRILLREYEGNYTGRTAHIEVTYVTGYQQKPMYVVFAFRLICEPNNPNMKLTKEKQ